MLNMVPQGGYTLELQETLKYVARFNICVE